MEENAPRVYSFGEFRLHPAILEYQGALVPLSPKAVDLLYLLASRAPAIVTKEEIFDAVWPGTFVVESSLARNVSVIRKALEERAPGPFIETIPKRGYRFIATLGEPSSEPAEEVPPLTPPPTEPPFTAPPRNHRRLWIAAATVAAVAAALWLRRPPPPAPTPDNPNARIADYLLARATPAEAAKALAYFEKAVKEHPTSAAAHAGLARTLALLPRLAAGGEAELRRAREEAQVAARLDPNHPATVVAAGITQLLVDWDFSSAERSFRRSLAAQPQLAEGLYFLSQTLAWSGRGDEALEVLRRARQADPVSPLFGMEYARVLYEQHRFEEAAAELRNVLDRDSHFTLAHYYLALTYGYLGRFDEARTHLDAAELNPHVLETDRAWLSLRQGDPGPARERYAQLRGAVRQGQLDPVALLLLATVLGEIDQAVEALAQGVERRDGVVLMVHVDPRLEALRREPRYQALRAKAGLPPAPR